MIAELIGWMSTWNAPIRGQSLMRLYSVFPRLESLSRCGGKSCGSPLAIATLVVAIGGLAAGAFIADAGGKVRHPEFRGDEKGAPLSNDR